MCKSNLTMKLNLPHYQFNIKKNDKGALVIFDHLRQRFITLTPEEWVRQNFVRFLIEEKQFPTALMGNEVSLLQNGIKRRCDTLVADIEGNPFVIVEYKAPSIPITQSVFDQIVRYNMVMKYTEYVPKDKEWIGFQAVEPRVQKSLTLEVQLAGINVSIKDVRNFLESNFIKNYNPVEEFLFTCYDNWDGKDHIRALARTVPTNNPHWEDWFYTWFLAMVEQWHNRTGRQYGNSVAPLLISQQGYNKSTFCRRLIPPQLQWGYTDNLILSEKRQVLQAMSQCLLINLDELNQISARVQQGFLKNLIQLPNVKYKPPYGSHVQEFPRTASFIATSNMDDILTDPSGNRRFIGIELTGPIDVSVRPNYQQLFAQAEKAIWNGEKTYFDAEQTALIMENNRRYQQIDPVMQCFSESFTPTEDENEGTFMTAAAIFSELKAKYGASLEAKSLLSFGRCLKNIDGLKRKRTMKGTEYLVIRRK